MIDVINISFLLPFCHRMKMSFFYFSVSCRRFVNDGLKMALFSHVLDFKSFRFIYIFYSSIVIGQSSDALQYYGIDVFQQLLRDSIANRASCFRAGMLSFLLDWFTLEENDDLIWKIAQLIQIIGGYSMSGKDIRKIFALLRSEKIGSRQNYCSLLMTSIQYMLKEKGPTAFFQLDGNDSVC